MKMICGGGAVAMNTDGLVDSLNVSVTGGIILHHIKAATEGDFGESSH